MRSVDFSEIYKLYAKRLYLYIYNKCRDTELAEDVVQTAFLKAIQNIDGFQGDSSIYSWITKIALNVLFEELKKSSARNVSLDEISSDGVDLSVTDSNILEDLIKDEERSELYDRISRLDENQQEIVKLRLQEVSFKKIGEIFDRNENWAKSNYHRAVKKLKEME
ncbi:MAG: sigma-70 family RNA polymerase sigma factor [Lachnospiraceae bacterium]|nr:sigma-70 family RNA polymerase sigma factor [Lachnospiraceae bacterium]